MDWLVIEKVNLQWLDAMLLFQNGGFMAKMMPEMAQNMV